jgi:hypothetical protein
MALVDDPKAHILHQFGREMHGRDGHNCEVFVEGYWAPHLKLPPTEKFYGCYNGKFYFSPNYLLMIYDHAVQSFRWDSITSCSSEHGSGDKTSKLTFVDGSSFSLPLAEMGSSWGSRISQLYHAMIKRWGHNASIGYPAMSIAEFFEQANDKYLIAPNMEPHPELHFFQSALLDIESCADVVDVRLIVADYDEGVPTSQGFTVVTSSPLQNIGILLAVLNVTAVVSADQNIRRKLGNLSKDLVVYYATWD